jgi:dephospho-CoA kinase
MTFFIFTKSAGMIRVGITGGIGSGKSTVARIFEVLGIPVYRADDAAKRLMQTDPILRQQLTELLGPDLYADGALNRKWMADRIFQQPALLQQVNALVHPRTLADSRHWMAAQHGPYALKEAALLFESGAQKDLDFVIGVYAPTPLRIHRVMQRDQVSREDVLARIKKQIDETIKMRLCDIVIQNDEQTSVIEQVLRVHATLEARSGNR